MYTVKIDAMGIAKACDAYVAAFDKAISSVDVAISTMFKIVVLRLRSEYGIDNFRQAIQVITAKKEKELSQRVGEASAHLFAAGASFACGSAFISATASAITTMLTPSFWLSNPNPILIGSTAILCSRIVANEVSGYIKATGFSRKLIHAFSAGIFLILPFNMYNMHTKNL